MSQGKRAKGVGAKAGAQGGQTRKENGGPAIAGTAIFENLLDQRGITRGQAPPEGKKSLPYQLQTR